LSTPNPSCTPGRLPVTLVLGTWTKAGCKQVTDRELMRIERIIENKKRFLDLLLLADEQENMIDKYLPVGDLFALYDDDLKSVCVVVPLNSATCELKNIATYQKYQGQGYGRALINFISDFYKKDYKTMIVGTGETPAILSFYESCGFEKSHRISNFFTDNYDHPIFEGDIQLVDMIYLKKEL
jgi:GNAT superfamily N-acetyltransferase